MNSGSPESWAIEIKHQRHVNCIVQKYITSALNFFLPHTSFNSFEIEFKS